MKANRTSALVLAGAVGLAGLGLGSALGPATASATSSTDRPASGRLDAIKAALAGLVKDGTIDQSQADKVADTLARNLPGAGARPGGAGLDAAAKAIGISVDDLRTALRAGRTLAQIAGDRGVDQDTLVAKLVTAERAELAAAVKAGRLTQAQADRLAADLKARITERVTSTRPGGGHRGGPGLGGHGLGGYGPGGQGPGGHGPGGQGPGDQGTPGPSSSPTGPSSTPTS